MRKIVLFFLAVGLTVFVTTPFAAAGIIQDLTANITFRRCDSTLCIFETGLIGEPASGRADFAQLALPWTYSFVTPPAYWWCGFRQCTEVEYDAKFGRGGMFTMTGPDGLTFSGIVTSGETVTVGAGDNLIRVDFYGQWSNGLAASGNIFEQYWSDQFGHVEAALQTAPVPEPGCLFLLSSGALAAWKYRTRLLS